MKSLFLLLLSICFAEYSYQSEVIPLGIVFDTAHTGKQLPEKYNILTDFDLQTTESAKINARNLWKEITDRDQLFQRFSPIIQLSGYKLRLTDVVLDGLGNGRLDVLEVRTNYTNQIRMETSCFFPNLIFSANFKVFTYFLPQPLCEGKVRLFLKATKDITVLADVLPKGYNVTAVRNKYIADVKVKVDLNPPNPKIEDNPFVLKLIIDTYKHEVLQFITQLEPKYDSKALDIIVPFLKNKFLYKLS